ncbi:MAG TPA: hypothetical protein VI386_35120 [Candidatus Sulfotelmatobacter sp.]
MAWTAVLIGLGLIALMGGTKTLILLVPVAWLVWQRAGGSLHSGRN